MFCFFFHVSWLVCGGSDQWVVPIRVDHRVAVERKQIPEVLAQLHFPRIFSLWTAFTEENFETGEGWVDIHFNVLAGDFHKVVTICFVSFPPFLVSQAKSNSKTCDEGARFQASANCVTERGSKDFQKWSFPDDSFVADKKFPEVDWMNLFEYPAVFQNWTHLFVTVYKLFLLHARELLVCSANRTEERSLIFHSFLCVKIAQVSFPPIFCSIVFFRFSFSKRFLLFFSVWHLFIQRTKKLSTMLYGTWLVFVVLHFGFDESQEQFHCICWSNQELQRVLQVEIVHF